MTNPSTNPGKQKSHGPDTEALEQAFVALRTYGPGSGRAALLPLDEEVAGCSGRERTRLEQRLLTALASCSSVVAREYICAKLVLIGSEASVPPLAGLLADIELSTGARNALQAIPGRAAARALRDSLPKLNGLQKIGAINSLGARRDEDSVRALSELLAEDGLQVKAAAAAALGNIGTVQAAKALQKFWAQAPAASRQTSADAMLVCAEHLMAAGEKTAARRLYELSGSRYGTR
jgi:HEAT repeat protein